MTKGGGGGAQLTELLASSADGLVVVVQHDAHLVHQADLFLIVTLEPGGARVDVWEQPQKGLGRGRRLFGDGGGSAGCGGHFYIRGADLVWKFGGYIRGWFGGV